MNIRQVVIGVVAFSLVGSTLPAMAATPAGSTPEAVAPEVAGNSFRASVDRAVAAAAGSETTATPAGSTRASLQAPLLPKQFANKSAAGALAETSNEEQGVGGAGGGSHIGLIITLVTTAASLAATYYVVKAMKKQTSSIPTPQVP
jgi:hypothetical protein